MGRTGAVTPHVVGLDIGGTKVRGLLLDADGARVASALVPTRPGPDGVPAAALECVDSLVAAAPGPVRVDAVGVGVPGLVDPASGTVAHAVNLGIDGEPLRLAAVLGERLGTRAVRVENDVDVAVVGAARTLGTDDVAYLALGTGVAAGLVLGGRLLRGHLGVAGEVGHLPYRPDGPRCACGQRGCLELYASGAALTAAWHASGGTGTAVDVFRAAADGDAAATRLRDDHADAVAACVQVLVLVSGVRMVVVGGGVADVGPPLRDAVARALAARAAGSPFLAGVRLADRVVLAPPGDESAALGAAMLAADGVPGPADHEVAV